MLVFGVVNLSPDSLNTDSIVHDRHELIARAEQLVAQGATAIDIGGEASTRADAGVDITTEADRVLDSVGVLSSRGYDVSIDTAKPEVARAALEGGATTINAADGMQHLSMWAAAATAQRIIVPFMNGTHPLHLHHVTGDPIPVMLEFFGRRLAEAAEFGLETRVYLDPGTGFGPQGWKWEDRYHYQKEVYSRLDELRVLGRPLLIPVPWRDTPQHAELLRIVMSHRPEAVRCHYPDRVLAVAAELSGSAPVPE